MYRKCLPPTNSSSISHPQRSFSLCISSTTFPFPAYSFPAYSFPAYSFPAYSFPAPLFPICSFPINSSLSPQIFSAMFLAAFASSPLHPASVKNSELPPSSNTQASTMTTTVTIPPAAIDFSSSTRKVLALRGSRSSASFRVWRQTALPISTQSPGYCASPRCFVGMRGFLSSSCSCVHGRLHPGALCLSLSLFSSFLFQGSETQISRG